MCQSLFFNKVAGLRPATLLKKRLWHRCFPMNFEKFQRTPFLQNTSRRLPLMIIDDTTTVIRSRLGKQMFFKKSEKKLSKLQKIYINVHKQPKDELTEAVALKNELLRELFLITLLAFKNQSSKLPRYLSYNGKQKRS